MTISQQINAQIDIPSRMETNKSSPLRVGSILRGEVLDIKADGKVLIDFGQARVLAQVQFPIKVGTSINVRIESTGKQLQLTLLPQRLEHAHDATGSTSPFERQGALLKSLAELIERATAGDQSARGMTTKPLPESVQQALMALRNFLQPIDIGSQAEIIAGQLKRWVENSGNYFEQRLMRLLSQKALDIDRQTAGRATGHLEFRELIQADMKANLFILRSFLDQAGQKGHIPGLSLKDLAELKTIVGLLIDDMGDKLQSLLKDRDSEHYLFSHLLNLIPKGHRGLLQVRVPKRMRSLIDSDVRLSLLLRLDRIGNIRSDLWLVKRGLRVTITVADSEVKQLIENNIQDLETVLHPQFGSLALEVKFADTMEADFKHDNCDVTDFYQQRTIDTSA